MFYRDPKGRDTLKGILFGIVVRPSEEHFTDRTNRAMEREEEELVDDDDDGSARRTREGAATHSPMDYESPSAE